MQMPLVVDTTEKWRCRQALHQFRNHCRGQGEQGMSRLITLPEKVADVGEREGGLRVEILVLSTAKKRS